jgi:hypothetical protein
MYDVSIGVREEFSSVWDCGDCTLKIRFVHSFLVILNHKQYFGVNLIDVLIRRISIIPHLGSIIPHLGRQRLGFDFSTKWRLLKSECKKRSL